MPLVLVELLVDDLVQRLPVHARLPRAHADADLDRMGRFRPEVHRLDGSPQPAPYLARTMQVGLGHRDAKLISPQPTTTAHPRTHARNPRATQRSAATPPPRPWPAAGLLQL